jgi:hypothetical protein
VLGTGPDIRDGEATFEYGLRRLVDGLRIEQAGRTELRPSR